MGWGLMFDMNFCYDIIVYEEFDIVVGVCEGNGLLIDIFDLVNLKCIYVVVDLLYVYWYGVMFS